MSKDKEKTFEILTTDVYGDLCLGDSFNRSDNSIRKPKGEVHIYEVKPDGNKELLHKSNLVVYQGRELLAQRLMYMDSGASTSRDEFLGWFGLGEGGVRPADPLDPTPPANIDTELQSLVPVNATSGPTYGDYHVASGIYPQTGYYKKLFDSAVFEPDIYNDNAILIIKITTTIGVDDANGQQLSEAGLYSSIDNISGFAGPFHLFGRVTFPSIIKTDDRRLIFIWYLYL